ncbi:MAG: hypothetical protein Q9217_002651 [Psora testacea]
MAGSRRSPLMRHQWRAEDEYSARHRDRAAERRPRSSSPSARREHSAAGLKIKGRAADDKPASASRETKAERKGDKSWPSRREAVKERSRSPHRVRVDDKIRHPGGQSDKRGSIRARVRDGSDRATYRRRTRSRSPAGGIFDFRDDRRRPASPYSGRTDRGLGPSSQRPDRAHSPSRALRSDLYSSTGRLGDSYVPSTRRRSPSTPPRRHQQREASPSRRRSRSRGRYPRLRKASLSPSRRVSPTLRTRSRRIERDSASSYRPRPRSRQSPKGKRQYISPPRVDKHGIGRERSRSSDRKRPRRDRSRDTEMQHSRTNSPPRPIQSFDATSQHAGMMPADAFPLHGLKASEVHGLHRQMRPPHLDTRQPYSTSPHWTPSSSHHGSPHSASPYNQARGGWAAQQQQYHRQSSMNAYSPPYRQNSYPPQPSPQAQYYPNGQQSPYAPPSQSQHGYQTQSFRGGHSGFRGNHYNHTPDRRFSGPGSSPTHGPIPSRGRGGHFQNLQWTANSNSRAQGDGQAPTGQMHPSVQQTPPQDDEDDNPFRPSKDLQVEDQTEKGTNEKDTPAASPKEGSKVSFAFKAKAAPLATSKPPPDLTQKVKQPSRKESLLASKEPPREEKTDDRRGRDSYDKYRSRDDRYGREYRHNREQKRDRGRERSPAVKIERKIMKRKRPKRTLSPSLADSTSVYYRKPGNESVVGSGTYGKVFKAIHVYTKNLAALKKIRMDGEKDGFPVTAVREIKLLQSLKHDNVVSLQEVMVEHNDCFMVFEYLSHDLTGLLNHPTFKLEHAHKKHLGKQLFEGLSHLHRRGVLHRDIKAANILVSNQGQLKLADFGLARFFSKRGKLDYTNRVVTIWYRSPELLLGETQYGPAVDIWSAACVMIEIFTRHAIFPGDGGEINQLDKIYNVLGTPTRSEWPGLVDMAWFELLRPTERKPSTFAEKYQERVTPAAFELLTAMFLYDPSKRPTASDALEHPYFTTEEPAPRQALELKDLTGDWHEFESKALRKENERKNQEARRAARTGEHEKDKAKRRASGSAAERDPKRIRPSSSQGGSGSK